MNDANLEAECFGGTYKAKVYDQCRFTLPHEHRSLLCYRTLNVIFVIIASSYPEERLRYWNGYLLFYERMEDTTKTPISAKKSRMSFRKHDRMR